MNGGIEVSDHFGEADRAGTVAQVGQPVEQGNPGSEQLRHLEAEIDHFLTRQSVPARVPASVTRALCPDQFQATLGEALAQFRFVLAAQIPADNPLLRGQGPIVIVVHSRFAPASLSGLPAQVDDPCQFGQRGAAIQNPFGTCLGQRAEATLACLLADEAW